MDSIPEIISHLNESRVLNEGKVGAFFMVNGDILSNDTDVRNGEDYADFVNYSSHWDLWRAAQKAYPELKDIEYDTFPRGRVVYNKKTHKYTIFIDPKLNNEIDLEIITMTYNLRSGSYIVDDTDEHYQSSDNPPRDVYIDESIKFDKSLDHYIKRETY